MAAYFKTRDGICKTIQLVLSLTVLIMCVLSTFWSVEGAKLMYVVFGISAFCSFTLTISEIIYYYELYYLCLASKSWRRIEICYGICCSSLMLVNMSISVYLTIKFYSLEGLPEYFKILLISCGALSLAASVSFFAYVGLIKRREPISARRLEEPEYAEIDEIGGRLDRTLSSISQSAASSRGERINLAFLENHAQSPTYIDVTVVQGSIMSANCDAIVNSAQYFSMSGQVGKLLVAQGGQSIDDDCANNPLYISTNLRITDAGALPYKFIFHLNVPNDVSRLENALLEMFKEADNLECRSLAMPPVGTGGIGLQAPEVAKCARKAIDKFQLAKPCFLQSISIYVFEQAMLGTFQQEFPTSRNNVSNSSLPADWDDMGRQLWKRVELSTNSQEYQRVLALFNLTLQKNVSKIERIQNPTLYNQFEAQKKKVTDVLAGRRPIITRELFHGTDADKCDSICNQGFDKGHAGKNGTAYGKGVYFATTAEYSDTYASGNPKHMFLAEVITGEYFKGDSSMKVAPMQRNDSPYDSVVDDVSDPSMFVVFKDASVYPAYLVTYT